MKQFEKISKDLYIYYGVSAVSYTHLDVYKRQQFKLYVNTNYLPAITDMTLFSSGRIVIIPLSLIHI